MVPVHISSEGSSMNSADCAGFPDVMYGRNVMDSDSTKARLLPQGYPTPPGCREGFFRADVLTPAVRVRTLTSPRAPVNPLQEEQHA